MRRDVRLAVLALLLGQSAHAADWFYTVRPGDQLWTLAARYCGSASFAPRIAAENGIADAAVIRPGSRLRITVEWLVRQPATAVVSAVRGNVFLLVPASRRAQAGATLEMGQRLRTDEGAAVVTFADGSTLQISERSEVLFNVLTAYGDTGMVDTNLRFYRGRSTSRMRPGSGGSRLRISKPFCRSSRPALARRRGSGLGLRFVKTVVERHGGSIEVANEVGAGARFTVTLPVIEPAPELTPLGE